MYLVFKKQKNKVRTVSLRFPSTAASERTTVQLPSAGVCRRLTARRPLFKQCSQTTHFNHVLHPENIWQFS